MWFNYSINCGYFLQRQSNFSLFPLENACPVLARGGREQRF